MPAASQLQLQLKTAGIFFEYSATSQNAYISEEMECKPKAGILEANPHLDRQRRWPAVQPVVAICSLPREIPPSLGSHRLCLPP